MKPLLRAALRASALVGLTVLPSTTGLMSTNVSYTHLSQAQINALTMHVNHTLAQLHHEGASQVRINRVLNRTFGLTPGVEVRSSGLAMNLMASTASDVNVYKPTYYWDNAHHLGFVDATWKWTSTGLQHIAQEVGCTHSTDTCQKNVGGLDGFGVAMNAKYYPSSYYLSTYNNGGSYQGQATLVDSGPDGAGFQGQDKFGGNIDYPGYSWYEGDATLAFKGFGGCGKTLQMFSKITHTWSGSAVNGVSVGVDSVGFSWTNTSYKWVKASQPSATYSAIGC